MTVQADDVHVADNGGGISGENINHVFEEFFTTKSIGKGLGLGLSISYRLAQDMGGELTVANGEQGGAVFTLKLVAAADGRHNDSLQEAEQDR